jgi:hypothetical protein
MAMLNTTTLTTIENNNILLNTEITITKANGSECPCLGQAHKWGRFKLVFHL